MLKALGALFVKNLLEFVRYPANMIFGFVMPIIWFIPTYFLVVSFAPDGVSTGRVLLVKDANTMVDASSFLVQGLTGTQNPPQVFPRAILAIAMAIPITYFIDLLRVETLAIAPPVAPGIEKLVLFAAAVIVPTLGLIFFSWVDRRVRTTGTIHTH